MKRYRSHKVVEAAQITDIGSRNGKAFLMIIGGATFDAPSGMFTRGTPKIGDYLVRYEPTANDPDGYLSWSPKAAFEAEYTEIVDVPYVAPATREEAIQRMRDDGDADPEGTARLNYPGLFGKPG